MCFSHSLSPSLITAVENELSELHDECIKINNFIQEIRIFRREMKELLSCPLILKDPTSRWETHTCMCVFVFVWVCVCLCPSLCLSLCLCLSICLSVHLSLSVCLSVFVSVYLSVCIHVSLSICLSVYLPLYACLVCLFIPLSISPLSVDSWLFFIFIFQFKHLSGWTKNTS